MRIGYLDPDRRISYPDALNHCCQESNSTHARPATTNRRASRAASLLRCRHRPSYPFNQQVYPVGRPPTGHTDVNYSFSGVVLLELQFQFLQRVELRLGDDLPVEEERKEVNGCEDRVRTSATDGRHERWENNGYERVGKP